MAQVKVFSVFHLPPIVRICVCAPYMLMPKLEAWHQNLYSHQSDNAQCEPCQKVSTNDKCEEPCFYKVNLAFILSKMVFCLL